MARLEFDSEGHAFLDIKLTERKDGFGAALCLRVPPRRGRSCLVLHDELFWGRDKEAAGNFINGLFVHSGNAHFTSHDRRFSITFRMSNNGHALFEAIWQDEDGRIGFLREVPMGAIESFQRRIRNTWKLMCLQTGHI